MRLKNVSDVYPLSPMQEGMLFHTVSEPELGAYVDLAVVTISGTIDPQRFNDSVQRVFSKFDSLKTAFVWEGVDQPLQIVRDNVQFPFESRNWQTRSNEQQRRDLLTLIAEQKANGFELEQAPLVRVFLCQCSTTNWQFAIVFHHLILDGWSTHKLVDRLLADCQGEAVESRESKEFRFRDYIQWMINQDHESASKFWKQELAGFKKPNEIGPPAVLSLDPPEEGKFHQNELRLGQHLSTSLREFSRQNRVTLNTLMQAAWSIIVGRYSGGATDVVFGTTVAGRPLNLDGVEEGIGSFINTIPFRTQLSNDISLNLWLSQIQTRQLDCRQWEFSSLVQIQQHSDVPAGTSLFESILVFENYPSTVREYGNLSITNIEHFEQSNYSLAFLVAPKDEIELIVISKESRYPDSIVQLIPEHLKYLLEEFVRDPTQPLGQLLIALPPQQRQQLLSWCCVDEILSPNQATVDELIRQAAKKTPGAVAVVFEDQQLTYQQLDEQSDVVAQMLIDHGVDLNQAVGICVERSMEMVIGIVGILKSGCCYLPLDVIYPIEHLEHVLEDSGVLFVLTSRLHKNSLPVSTNRKLLLLDEMESCKPPRDLPSMSNPDRLAYIIFTSGSTGKPKGVMITHQNLSQSTLARTNYYQENPQSYLLLSSFAFDSSVAGIFWTLCTGGKLVLPKRNAEQDMFTLIALLQREKVSHILCLPALYQVLVETSQADQLSALRVVIVAGDKVSASVANAHFKYAPQVQLYNEYGPTEGTVWATAHQIKSTGRSIIPIGKPIDSTGVVLLDSNDRPVPIGATGEICLTGHGLARGYLNNAELTNRKFAEGFDYFGSVIRMYRTGDVAYFQQDGSLVFCGRTDQQVKIRGYRIEPGEIESALASFDDVDDVAVVTHRESESSPSRILAFVSGESATEDRQRWVMRLNQRLPEFMIPDLFMRLEKIPRLPNGKVDRTALPKPKRVPVELKQPNMAPSGDIQTQLAAIWREALGLDEVGIDENFFEVGGHSLNAMMIINRIEKTFQRRISVRSVFGNPTIRLLSELFKEQP